MRPYLDPAGRNDLIAFLMAVDQFDVANRAALAALHRACPDVEAMEFDLSAGVVNQVGLFSRDLEFVRAVEEGDRGTVTVQIARRVPLVELAFTRRDDRWLYACDDDLRDVTPLLREAATGLERLADLFAKGPRTPDQIRRAYRLRVAPSVQQIAELATKNQD